jgi:hypothetical protein
MITIGIDPGQRGAIALVSVPTAGLSTVLGVWSIDGTSKALPWWDRADIATRAALAIAEQHGGLDLIVSEIPGGGGASRKPLSPVTWLTMGRRLGEVVAMLRLGAPTARAVDITSAEWPKALRLVVGKQPYQVGGPVGWHRVIEARTLTGSTLWQPSPSGLRQAEADRMISQAEAVLIAIAGARSTP